LVIGISGGIDSAVTAAIARKVCDKIKDVTLHGLILPGPGTKEDEYKRSKAVAFEYCHNVYECSIKALSMVNWYNILQTTIDISEEEKIRYGNVQARIRMIFLYDTASREKGIVLSTGNLTEYNLGFWTLHGDVGDFGFIQNLWKTEVYELGEYLANCAENKGRGKAILDCVNATPTDGLGISNSDIDQIIPDWNLKTHGSYRKAYEVIDNILSVQNKVVETKEETAIVKMQKCTEYKRNNPFEVKRRELFKS
jgi:nicotinamide-nucleotide amidase